MHFLSCRYLSPFFGTRFPEFPSSTSTVQAPGQYKRQRSATASPVHTPVECKGQPSASASVVQVPVQFKSQLSTTASAVYGTAQCKPQRSASASVVQVSMHWKRQRSAFTSAVYAPAQCKHQGSPSACAVHRNGSSWFSWKKQRVLYFTNWQVLCCDISLAYQPWKLIENLQVCLFTFNMDKLLIRSYRT